MAETHESQAPIQLSDIFSPMEIQMLDQIAHTVGFRFEPDPNAGPDDVGYVTDLERRIVYFNPHTLATLAPYRKFACFAHELGHHFPDVVAFQDACMRMWPIVEQLLPKEMPHKKRFLASAENILDDVLLESAIPQHGEVVTQKLFSACFRQNRGALFLDDKRAYRGKERLAEFEASDRKAFPWAKEDFLDMETAAKTGDAPKPIPSYAQFMHLHLIAPFFGLPPAEFVSPSVAKLYPHMQHAFQEMTSEHMTGDRKAPLFVEFVRHLAALIEERFEEIRNEGGNIHEAMEEFEQQVNTIIVFIDGMTAPGKPTQSVPEQQSGVPGALSTEQRNTLVILVGKGKSAQDMQLAREAAEMGMSLEHYKRFLETCEQYQPQIDSLTETLVRFVLREYRKDYVGHQRTGIMVTPGRGVETYHRLRGGEERPPTMIDRRNVLAPKTLQLYKLLDTSGSMEDDLDGTLGFYTVVTKSALSIQEELRDNYAKYDLRKAASAPVELEITGFSHYPFLILPLTGNLDLPALGRGYTDILNQTGKGGTDDAAALKFEYNRMRLGDPRTLKILSMVTDGEGQGEGVRPIINQIQDDPDIYFMVNGIGKRGYAVQQFYLNAFKPAHYYHVHASVSRTVAEAVPKNIEFIEQCIKHFFGE